MLLSASVSNVSGYPASGPVYCWQFGLVRSVTPAKTQTAIPWRVCYPDRTEIMGFLAWLESDHGSILLFLHCWLQLSI
jgi:hypothetical protein